MDCKTKNKQKVHVLPPGTKLMDRYVLREVIGEGNFGITYMGEDTLLETPVAIKEFFPVNRVSRNVETGDTNVYVFEDEEYEKSLEKYLDEGKRLSRLNQVESIVSIHNYIRANGTAYIVMEYIEGTSVKSYVEKHGPLSMKQVLEQMWPVMEALEKVHALDIIHRDISPDNIVMNADEKLVLLDFGSARQVDVGDEKSKTVLIKDGYSPPELYVPRGEQGAWSDVYAICATMYFMMTGTVPEGGVARLLRDELIPLTKVVEVQGSYGVKAAIQKGMCLKQEERYASISDLKKALCKARASKRTRAFPWKWLGLTGATVVVIGLLICYGRGLFSNEEKMELVATGVVEDTVTTTVDVVETTIPFVEDDVAQSTITPQTMSTVIVPDVKGMTYKKAAKSLENVGLTCRIVWVKSEKKRGRVIKQSQAEGVVCQAGTEIRLRVSKGAMKAQEETTTATQTTRRNQGSEPTKAKQYDGVIE